MDGIADGEVNALFGLMKKVLELRSIQPKAATAASFNQTCRSRRCQISMQVSWVQWKRMQVSVGHSLHLSIICCDGSGKTPHRHDPSVQQILSQ
ncbi:hypothetical protein FGO68_gene15041 [Halteria grandinella]|uniref:Uncharacterized protein n=1 Tax=Halteria grandinella TaxID=5974 RepID=A0A8J8SUR3_HALGN|nr:hypothetical protein FGO68_gene15041 [Halteria grandinella]